jgi:hypothetical protein
VAGLNVDATAPLTTALQDSALNGSSSVKVTIYLVGWPLTAISDRKRNEARFGRSRPKGGRPSADKVNPEPDIATEARADG